MLDLPVVDHLCVDSMHRGLTFWSKCPWMTICASILCIGFDLLVKMPVDDHLCIDTLFDHVVSRSHVLVYLATIH